MRELGGAADSGFHLTRPETIWQETRTGLDRMGSQGIEGNRVRLPERLGKLDAPNEVKRPDKKLEPKAVTCKAELNIGSATDGHVRVHRIDLDPSDKKIRITDARGVQIGDHIRQKNEYRYKVRRAEFSLDRLLAKNPGLRSALARLVEKPGSVWANYAFRHALPRSKTRPVTGIRFAAIEKSGSGGQVTVERSKAIMIGDRTRQYNRFKFSLASSALAPEQILRGDPKLVRLLAVAVKYAEMPAAQRSFATHLAAALGRPGLPEEVRHRINGPAEIVAMMSHGVQLGTDAKRWDRVQIDLGSFVVNGCDTAAALFRRPEAAERDRRLDEASCQRVLDARRAGGAIESADRDGLPHRFVHEVTMSAAAALLEHVAADRGHLSAQMSDRLETALDRPEMIGSGDIGRLPAVVLPSRTGFGLLAQSDQVRGANSTSGLAATREVVAGQGADGSALYPGFRLIALGAERSSVQVGLQERQAALRPWPGAGGALGAGQGGPVSGGARGPAGGNESESGQAVQPQGGSHGPIGPAAYVTVAMVCQPMAVIAAAIGTRLLAPATLLAYVRRRAREILYDGTPGSVVAGLRAARALRVVVFLDPELGIGLWIDVDPLRQAPAATLLIEFCLAAAFPGTFRVLAYDATVSAHAVSSATRS
jgi:hypothetical protein